MKTVRSMFLVFALAACSFASTVAADGHECGCLFAGQTIPEDVYANYPTSDPGKYNDGTYSSLAYYGTVCAAWDQMPGTPWNSYCPAGSDWSDNDYNWCQQPWCYVDAACADGVPSSVFAGSDVAFYSYQACGHHADCYTDIMGNDAYTWPEGCPYDPTGEETYKVFKGGDCACVFEGEELPDDIKNNYPEDEPGKYASEPATHIYGTTCAAWDQMPGTPWYDSCPADSDWCHQDYNWCQLPWCYVDAACTTGVASSVFAGSSVAFYSYDTCLSTPDCYTDVAWEGMAGLAAAPSVCPFDQNEIGWFTSSDCHQGWSQTCGETKEAYRNSGCCGMPEMTFKKF